MTLSLNLGVDVSVGHRDGADVPTLEGEPICYN